MRIVFRTAERGREDSSCDHAGGLVSRMMDNKDGGGEVEEVCLCSVASIASMVRGEAHVLTLAMHSGVEVGCERKLLMSTKLLDL